MKNTINGLNLSDTLIIALFIGLSSLIFYSLSSKNKKRD